MQKVIEHEKLHMHLRALLAKGIVLRMRRLPPEKRRDTRLLFPEGGRENL